MLPVTSDPDTTFSQVIAVAKCTLSFHNLTSSRMVEVKQLRNFFLFIINLGRIKQNNKKQMLLKEGIATPSIPPLDPPLGKLRTQPRSQGLSSSRPRERERGREEERPWERGCGEHRTCRN